MTAKGIIARVVAGSIADELELSPGDKMVAVNGSQVKDIIDLSFALADETVELVIEKQNGDKEIFEIEKDYDEDLGIEWESAVFDQVKQCGNKCLFCFIDQMPPGLRESLYVKDDDYRLSFLYGNFITLTNIGSRDLERIRRLHLSPLYVSVHTTDGPLRARMLGNPRAKQILNQLKLLVSYGVELHTQIVLCPGWNDGEVLERTIADLYSLAPGVLSLAIVPVGLTAHRRNCQPLETFSLESATEIICSVTRWQKRCREETGSNFVYLADEFYLAAGSSVPEYDQYDGFPQLENGVGIVRNFLSEWDSNDFSRSSYTKPFYLDVVCGESAARILQPLLNRLTIPNLTVRLVPVINRFFGSSITVTGLLTGQDIIASLENLTGPRDGIILPGVALRKGENIFLDGVNPEEVAARFGVPVRSACSGIELGKLLAEWG